MDQGLRTRDQKMNIPVDIWIRGTDFATTKQIESVMREPDAWTEEDVRAILEGMLHAMDEAKNPGQSNRVAALRGFSWIVNSFEGGVLIAIEMTLGAAVAGPFPIDKIRLEGMITRVMAAPGGAPPTVVH
jgi:hypothetical protein